MLKENRLCAGFPLRQKRGGGYAMMKRTPVRLMSALAAAILVVIAAGCGVDTYLGKEAYVDEGPTLKRMRPRARGSADRINKRTSHVTVVVAEKI